MAEEQAAQPEQKEQGEQAEILNLPQYGALYGRFLLASLPEAKINDIVNPDNKKLEFNNLTADTLEKRNYNPIFENFSFNERQEEWKTVPLFNNAYNQWRTKFTGFMINIQDSQREKALRIILANNKEAKEFTVNDADTLFKEFCDGKSDITNFLKRVTTNLVNDGEINPANLQKLLPHLQWIASGLFGKDTASYGVTRLIELESALCNNPSNVLNVLNEKRINNPGEDEKRILGLLHKSLPVQQESKPVTTADAPKPPPVPPGKEDELPVAPPPPQTPPIAQTAEAATAPNTTTAANTESIINLERKDDFIKELNDKLSTSTTETHFTFGVSPDILKSYFISFARSKGAKLKEGIKIEVMGDNKIAVRGIEITKSQILVTGKINVDLILSNGPSGITVEVQNYKANNAASIFGGDIESKIKELDTIIKNALKEQLHPINQVWTAQKLSIAGDKVLIRFEKLQVAVAAVQTPTLTAAEAEPESDAHIEIIDIPGAVVESGKAVKLKINGNETGLDWAQLSDGQGSWEEGQFWLMNRFSDTEGNLQIPKGTRLIMLGKESIFITGGKDMKLSIADLKERLRIGHIGLTVKDSRLLESFSPYFSKEDGQATYIPVGSDKVRELSIEEVVVLLRRANEGKK